MKNVKMKLAIFGVLGTLATQASATGLVTIPTAGFASSAYTDCFNTGRTTTAPIDPKGNFGSYQPVTNPTTTVNNTCATFPANENTAPEAGYTLVVSATRTIPTVTGGAGNIGTVVDRVWRKPAATAPVTPTAMCIFGAKVTMVNSDHDSGTAGTQYFEVNDIARGGFSGSGDVTAGYYLQVSTASPIYRIGRTFTSVQHRALKYSNSTDKQFNGTNYLDLPTKNSVTAAITGENTPIAAATAASTTAATQDAVVNSNWIDFTTDAVFVDDDGGTNVGSGVTYVKAACNDDSAATINSTWVKAGAISLRQTAQENTTFKAIDISGYAPPGATVP